MLIYSLCSKQKTVLEEGKKKN